MRYAVSSKSDRTLAPPNSSSTWTQAKAKSLTRQASARTPTISRYTARVAPPRNHDETPLLGRSGHDSLVGFFF